MKRTILKPARRRAAERGSLLITVSMVILVMLILAIPFLVKLSAESRSTERAARALAALNLAEAGVDKAVWDLNHDFASPYDPTLDPERIVWNADWTAGAIADLKTPDNAVSGDVAIILEPDPDPTGMTPGVTRHLQATGLVPFIADRTVDRTVGVVLERYFGSIFDYGFVIDEYFRITNTQLTVDSYDSRVANYDPANPDTGGIMAILNPEDSHFIVDQGGGGTIDVTGGLYAGADLMTDDDPDTVPTDAIADTVIDLPKQVDDEVPQYAMDSIFNLPDVDLRTLHPRETWPSTEDISYWFSDSFGDRTELPAWDQVNTGFKGATAGQGKTLSVSGSSTLTTGNNGIYTSFVMADGANLTVAANQNVVIMVSEFSGSNDVAEFTMGQGANIVLGEGASLTLILGRTSFYMGHMSTINVPLIGTTDEPGIPGDCLILGMKSFDPLQDPSGTLPATNEEDLSKKTGLAIQKDHSLSPLGAMIFEQQVDIAAAMYTPKARSFDLQGMNHADIYGCWLANSLIFKVAAGFHYDKALGDVMTLPGGTPKWKIVSWQERIGN